MRIFFSVGEPSGDEHAASLINSLKEKDPTIQCEGLGGPEMKEAGCEIHTQLTDYAVMGITQVLPLIWTFLKIAWSAKKHFQTNPPDLVVLVDFPGFNWWIARYAKDAGIKVVYYLPPQLWAWAPWRIKRVQRNVDYILSGLSFEKEWYESRGVKTEFVSHPFFDEVAERKLDQNFLELNDDSENPVIAILPGSRTMEIQRNWPVITKVVSRVHAQNPNAKFLVANYRDKHMDYCKENASDLPKDVNLEYHLSKTSEIIEASTCTLMVSGSVSLEVLAREKPAIVFYRSPLILFLMVKLMVYCKYMTLPNLMAKKEVLPEFPFCFQAKKRVKLISNLLNSWLSNPVLMHSKQKEIQDLKSKVVQPGATNRVANFLLSLEEKNPNEKIAA